MTRNQIFSFFLFFFISISLTKIKLSFLRDDDDDERKKEVSDFQIKLFLDVHEECEAEVIKVASLFD